MRPAPAKASFFLTMLLIGFSSVWIILYTTRWGIGLFGWDSFSYISGARNLAQGNGYAFPYQNDQLAAITHFPPGLSSFLAVFEMLGVDAIAGARSFNAVLFGLSAVLAGLTIRVSTQSNGFGFLSALLFLSSPTMIEIYSFAMSEGLYLCLTLLGFLLFNEALKKNLRVALLTAVLVLGSAGLTRSAAVANIAAALIVYVLWREKPTLRKLGEAALFGFLCLLPALWWAGYIYRLTMTFNDRQPGFYPLVLKNYLTAVRTIFTWVLPEHFVTGYEGSFGIFLLALSLGTSLFYLWFWFQKTRTLSGAILSFRRFPLVALLFGSFSLFYLAVIFVAKTFFDPAIGMSARILSPLLLSLIVLGVQFLHSLWKRGFLPLRGFSLVVAAYLLFFNLYFARYTVAEFHDKGLGLGRAEVQNSETMQSLPELARSYPVFSNDPFSLYFFTDQVGYRLNGFSPEKVPTGVAVLAIFGTGEDHPVYRKYSDYLELLAKDSIASLYIYRSSAVESNTEGTNGDLTTTRDLRWVHTLARFNGRLYN